MSAWGHGLNGKRRDHPRIPSYVRYPAVPSCTQPGDFPPPPLRRCSLAAPWRRLVLGFALAATLIAPVFGARNAAEIEAAFIEKFTHYIEWPEESRGATPGDPFTMCVLGRDPIQDALESIAEFTMIKGRPARVLRVFGAREAQACDLLYVAKTRTGDLPRIHTELAHRSVLIVTHGPGLAEQGAMINFYDVGDRLRFEINVSEARESGLKISARLLRLARIVGKEPAP